MRFYRVIEGTLKLNCLTLTVSNIKALDLVTYGVLLRPLLAQSSDDSVAVDLNFEREVGPIRTTLHAGPPVPENPSHFQPRNIDLL